MRSRSPKFHGILMTLEAADIIEQTIAHALTWADTLHICDTGSTDGTWDLVSSYARREPRIRATRWDRIVFHEGVRSAIFNEARKQATPGDWFAKVDEDEFFHVPPPTFIARFCRPHDTAVWAMNYEFRLTTADAGYSDHSAVVEGDRKRLIKDRLRHFIPLRYSEARMFRYRRTMAWPPEIPWPWNAGYVARRRIPMRHYPHRDSLQLRRRVEIRRAMLKHLPPQTYSHWKVDSWRDYILDANNPELVYWQPGTDLPVYDFANHLAPVWKRCAQRVAHGLFLPVLDRVRRTYPENYHPAAMPEHRN